MAVITQKNGNNLLGTLGTIATLGGSLIPGAQWLGALGTGLNTANALSTGNYAGALGTLSGNNATQGGLAQILSSLSGMFTPKQNINTNDMTDQDLYKKWGRYYKPQTFGGVL